MTFVLSKKEAGVAWLLQRRFGLLADVEEGAPEGGAASLQATALAALEDKNATLVPSASALVITSVTGEPRWKKAKLGRSTLRVEAYPALEKHKPSVTTGTTLILDNLHLLSIESLPRTVETVRDVRRAFGRVWLLTPYPFGLGEGTPSWTSLWNTLVLGELTGMFGSWDDFRKLVGTSPPDLSLTWGHCDRDFMRRMQQVALRRVTKGISGI